MAYAEKRLLPVANPPFEVTLTLDQDEANFLMTVLQNIGGSTVSSPRKHQEAITSALHAAGVPAGDLIGLINPCARQGAIYFFDYGHDTGQP